MQCYGTLLVFPIIWAKVPELHSSKTDLYLSGSKVRSGVLGASSLPCLCTLLRPELPFSAELQPSTGCLCGCHGYGMLWQLSASAWSLGGLSPQAYVLAGCEIWSLEGKRQRRGLALVCCALRHVQLVSNDTFLWTKALLQVWFKCPELVLDCELTCFVISSILFENV